MGNVAVIACSYFWRIADLGTSACVPLQLQDVDFTMPVPCRKVYLLPPLEALQVESTIPADAACDATMSLTMSVFSCRTDTAVQNMSGQDIPK